ncbi:peptidase U32 family protein [Fusobacterium ulcerans]|uniref:peptidase U32 family protein n=1 Tax=Fusobacterium ulcerans TaxID=861 RepID=UPI001D0A6613|nr:U32 family peptidase [Fusobacterium ulcerans]MCB8565947.1 U32 family peptidase [Fusobacterium ulcerans]MCB8647970.1 U32 family peptidase [Fusobacterium ulcerans]HJH06880.1 U32 family peptidase [Fusobacterium ulcerans]
MKIVAPAGNMERFYAAVKAGAQEIYMGLKGFGARRNAENFTLEEYKEALDYAHKRGVRIFLTLNTIMMEKEMDFLYENLKALYEHGLDAVIVQDLGYFRYMKENFPDMEYHGSTQMTVGNHIEAEYLRKIGFKRVVLPREMTFEEIKKIRENTSIELEIFVSGALCICYSGNCYMSSFIGSRSGNRGMCAQPCRKEYTDSKGNKGYLLSPKDQLMGYDEIQKLKEIGIESIKVEGRMKDPNYVFETVGYYSQMINGEKAEERVSEIFNRGYSKGYFHGADSSLINKNYSYNLGKEIGLIFGRELKLKDRVVLGDGIIYLSKDYEKLGGGYLNKIEVKGSKEARKSAESGETIFLKDVPRGSKYIFRSFAKEVNDDVENKLKKYDQKLDITGEFFGNLGEKPVLILEAVSNQGKKIRVEKLGENEIEAAAKRAATPEDIVEKLKESGDSTFNIVNVDCHISEGIFLPVSVIKSLRREAAAELEELLVESYRRKAGRKYEIPYEEDEEREVILSVIVSNDAQEKAVKSYGIEKIYRRGYDIAREGMLKEQDLNNKLASNLYQLIENKNNDTTINWNLNVSNRYTIEELSKLGKAETVILSPEISFEKIKEIGKTSLRKAILGYSRLKGMYVEIPLFDRSRETIENSEGDRFTVVQNNIGNSEIFFERPLNILNDMSRMKKLHIDEIVAEFTIETPEEVREILENMETRAGIYRAFNYERGVY